MEDFKIITLPEKKEEDNQPEENTPILKKRDDDYNPPKKRYLFLLIVFIVCIASFMVIRIITTYDDYEVEHSWDRKDSAESKYLSFQNNLLKYNPDGIFYTTYEGSLIWNYSYDMTNPQIDTCGQFIVVYDKKGSEVYLFSAKGFIKQITLTIPVIDAKIANQGTVALLLQENNVSYIQMYDKNATLLVSGEIHPENKGFPISMALSSDATRLLLSIINVNNGELSTELVFYDFTNTGKKEEDNIVASYKYIGDVIPKVEYVKNNKALAFANNKIIVFNNNLRATVAKNISVPGEMKSIFYNDTHFGFIYENALESGEIVNQINTYNLYGLKTMSKQIEDNYSYVSMMDNNEILISDGNTVKIFNLQGFEKFDYTFDETIYNVIPGPTSKRYYLIEETKTEEIGLK